MSSKGISKKSKVIRKVKAKKDPKAPKKPRSAYIIFCTEKREQVKSGKADAKPSDIMKELGALWKGMTSEEKAPFEDRARADKHRHEDEMKGYTPSAEFLKAQKKAKSKSKKSGKEKKGKKKDPNQPKRAMSAYLFYGQDKREEVKTAHPEMKSPEIMQEIGRMWRELTEDQKLPYIKMADDDKARYTKAKASYDANKPESESESSSESESESDSDSGSDSGSGSSDSASD